MAKRTSYILLAACSILMLASCTGNGEKGHRAPIVLGDSSTIITETDPRYTHDLVADLHPNIPTKTHQDEEETKPATPDSSKPVETPATAATATPVANNTKQPAPPAPAGNGLTVTFKDVSVSIPGIVVKSYRPQDAMKANGVSYQLVSGNIQNSRLVINSGTAFKVSMRYQSQLVVNGEDNDLPLDNLSTTTDWVPVAGNKNNYPVKGLESARLEAPEFTAGSLRNAISRASRRHRLSRKREQEFQASVRNVRRAGQRPISVVLRSVMWKIDGKDAAGKQFSKQIRVDLP